MLMIELFYCKPRRTNRLVRAPAKTIRIQFLSVLFSLSGMGVLSRASP